MLIAIEGVDGAGKRTLTEGLSRVFRQAGRSVVTLAFPRYGQSLTADIAAEALHGEHGDLASSVYAMAMLFALDRAGAAPEIETLCRDHDVVILDRYVASNAAYSAARLHEDATGPAVAWVHRLEYQRLGLPPPDWQVLLAVSAELAGQRARSRARSEPGRARDSYERDDGLQQRTGAVYAELAAAGWGGRWLVVDADVDPGRLATTLIGAKDVVEGVQKGAPGPLSKEI
ncbi:dTMP kinase [Mycobacterium sp.]|uniref:dTMP kinase n=1 Tax=Mycobacterium sp. TaxID=1785 RepID=UPI003C776757